MRKKLTIRRQTIRQLTVAERAAIIGGAPTNTPACDPWPDIPPRLDLGPTKYAQHCITASCPDQT